MSWVDRNQAAGTIGAMFVLLVVACESQRIVAPTAREPAQLMAMHDEIARLSAKIAALETQLQSEHRNTARARQETIEQRERIAALENQVPGVASGAAAPTPTVSNETAMQAEAELRTAYRALMRAIERLDISPEEKAALKGSLRPTRSLDRDNPWSVAKRPTP